MSMTSTVSRVWRRLWPEARQFVNGARGMGQREPDSATEAHQILAQAGLMLQVAANELAGLAPTFMGMNANHKRVIEPLTVNIDKVAEAGAGLTHLAKVFADMYRKQLEAEADNVKPLQFGRTGVRR